MNSYGLSEIIKNIISLVYTKIFFINARLIRLPIYIRGKRYIKYGKGLTTGYRCRFETFKISSFGDFNLYIGDNCKMGDYVHISAGENVVIGNNCLLASKIFISDISHGDYRDSTKSASPLTIPDERPLVTSPIKIGDNVWIGENVCILPGSTIGDGCIIGANAVVNSKIPSNCIAVGIPARVVKIYDSKIGRWKKFE
jgi:acetyltransferase-like isoleucine patch superfamily enzyme